MIIAIATLFTRWLRPATRKQAFTIGTIWVVLMLLFEVGLGRLIMHLSWHAHRLKQVFLAVRRSDLHSERRAAFTNKNGHRGNRDGRWKGSRFLRDLTASQDRRCETDHAESANTDDRRERRHFGNWHRNGADVVDLRATSVAASALRGEIRRAQLIRIR